MLIARSPVKSSDSSPPLPNPFIDEKQQKGGAVPGIVNFTSRNEYARPGLYMAGSFMVACTRLYDHLTSLARTGKLAAPLVASETKGLATSHPDVGSRDCV